MILPFLKGFQCPLRCYRDGRFEQAVGIALESRRLDKLEETVNQSQDRAATLVYALRVCQELVIHKGFRQEVFSLALQSETLAFTTDQAMDMLGTCALCSMP